MKKHLILLFFLILSFNAFCVELWNGFTTDMSKEDVIIRANRLFNLARPTWIYNFNLQRYTVQNFNDNYIHVHGNDWFYSRENNIYRMPQIDEEIGYNINSSIYNNVSFCFYNNKLFYLKINWVADRQYILQQATSQFGNPQINNLRDYNYNFEYTIYKWNLSERILFIGFYTFNDKEVFYVDSIVRDNWLMNQELIEQQEKQRQNELQERNTREANSGLLF